MGDGRGEMKRESGREKAEERVVMAGRNIRWGGGGDSTNGVCKKGKEGNFFGRRANYLLSSSG